MRVRLVLFVACLIIFGSCVTPALGGADLGRRPAPDFTLVDGPTGETVSLSALRGNVVVLAFLYMACPDVCPRTAEKLLAARDGVGSAGSILALVAVSVAPDRDTPEATRRFLSNH